MALLDREHNLIVLRIVYDGPPEAGKTTSLRALAGSLGQTLFSPAEENGRTLYFDWMDYTGGRFEGYRIRCQIVSVPGQAELRARRHHLLREADVVVYVADSTSERLEATTRSLCELPTLLPREGPPVGVLLQANKRDLPDAVPLTALRAALVQAGLGSTVGVVESIASEGAGIRETFVFAVRLALDRVREQLRTQTLPEGPPRIDTGDALLEEMQRQSTTSSLQLAPSVAAPLIQQVMEENDLERLTAEFAPWREGRRATSDDEPAPWPPDPTAPSGAIWPPVEGRLLLHEATALRLTTHRLQNGSWAAGLGNGWRAYSIGTAVYGDVDSGREALIAWARLHVACARVLSGSRCIVLAATGQGTLRLWQIVRAERSLRDRLEHLDRCPTEEAAARIVEAATLLCDLSARLGDATCSLPCTLDTVGQDERGAVYIGLMPMERAPTSTSNEPDRQTLGIDLESIFTSELAERRGAVRAALRRTDRRPTHGGLLVDRLLERLAQR